MTLSDPESLSFETALTELERVLRLLEDGATTLEDSLSSYERGVGLMKRCYQQLRDAEQKIALLSGVDADGQPKVQAFDHSASFAAPKPDEKRRTPRAKPKEQDGLY